MKDMKERLAARVSLVERALDVMRRFRPGWSPEIGLVLGSGLGRLADEIEDRKVLPYGGIPGMPVSSVPGHAGALVTGTLAGRRVAAMQGRVHLYEGFSADEVVLGVRAIRLWGAGDFIVTNASGSLRPEIPVGTLLVMTDHLNLQGVNCLAGPNPDRWGPRFPDMGSVYFREAGERLLSKARSAREKVDSGVYAGLPGPSYETPSEVNMLARLGADVVGMSTVQEATALRHMGARVLGISCVTNLASGVGTGPLDHAEVSQTALAVSESFARLVLEGIRIIGGRLQVAIETHGEGEG